MANRSCLKCKQDKTLANFISVPSQLHCGYLPICRSCLNEIIKENTDSQKGNWEIVNKICQWADIPFIPEEWDRISKEGDKDSLGMYIAIFRAKKFEGLNWEHYNRAYLQLEKEGRFEDAVPALKEEQIKSRRKKWGYNYDEEQLEYLENLHNGLILSQNIVGALNEDQALKLCKISLIIEEKIRANVDFTKDLKAYDELAKLANLTPKNVKDANEFDSFGEVFAYLEKTGWQNKYYQGAVRDEIDNTERNMKNWLRYLYVNETGVAEEIEERINNLKTAAELSGEEFNEKEFRDYIKNEDNAKEEDFKIEL